MKILAAVVRELRPRQYTKNLLVFAGALFAGRLGEPGIFGRAALAFVAFSACASAVYVLNDILDAPKDRLHPVKRFRPIAAGELSLPVAWCLLGVLLVFGGGLGRWLDGRLVWVLGIYFVMNVAYSFWLKHIAIIDVMVIALGFVLRALAGVMVIDVEVTSWFVVCVFMLALFLALAKRRGELKRLEASGDTENGRRVLASYSVPLLNALLVTVLASSLTSYVLFAMQSAGEMFFAGLPEMLLTVPLVVYGLFRYLLLMDRQGAGERPEEVLLRDQPILFTCIFYAVLVFLIR